LNSNKRWSVEGINTPSEKDGKKYNMLSMPLRKLPAYMASINPNKVKLELRPTIEMYQDECDDALWDYWNKGKAVNLRHVEPSQLVPQSYADALELAAKKIRECEAKDIVIANKDRLIMASNEASIKAGEILVREFAKSIDFIDVGQNKMYEWLRASKFLMQNNEPYQHYVDFGWFTWKPSEKEINGEYRYTVRITPRGKVMLTKRYMDYVENRELGLNA